MRQTIFSRFMLLSSLVLVTGVAPLDAQVGDISQVNYPGWTPSDRVAPTYTVAVTYDASVQQWRYDYTLANSSAAAQPIWSADLRYNGLPLSVTAPAGWRGVLFRPTGRGLPGVSFMAKLPSQYGAYANGGPAPAHIPPGQALTGFSLTSTYPPGYARHYTQGWAQIPYLPAPMSSEQTNLPDDTLNSRRGYTVGPTRYTRVVTGGNRRPGADGFLGFMNLATSGTILGDPAPIALKFSLNGETVFRETLRVELNGVDVTAQFKPGPSDGADLVGLFAVGSSPLLAGKNVLLTSVEGLLLSSGSRAADADRITFTVDPTQMTNGSSLTAYGLENLPIEGPIVAAP